VNGSLFVKLVRSNEKEWREDEGSINSSFIIELRGRSCEMEGSSFDRFDVKDLADQF